MAILSPKSQIFEIEMLPMWPIWVHTYKKWAQIFSIAPKNLYGDSYVKRKKLHEKKPKKLPPAKKKN